MGKRLNLNNKKHVTFTMADGGLSPLLRTGNGRRAAFTLAEILITLGIIGVVAALTIPMFMKNINEQVKASRIENIKQKLSKVTDKMASLDRLQGYQSTGDFIDEMKNHMNIAKICKDHVENCWPTSEVTIRKYATGTKSNTYQISNITEPTQLRLSNSATFKWGEPVGIITADGTSMIISYNKNCSITSDTGLVFDQASSTSNTLSCIAGIYDWNGKSKPNKLGDDVQSLGVAGIKGSCSYESEDGALCVLGSAHIPTSMSLGDCQKEVQDGSLGIKYCNYENDYWAGAVAECGGKTHMFSMEELGKFQNYIYTTNNDRKAYNKEKALALGLPANTSFYIWSNVLAGTEQKVASNYSFGTNVSGWGPNQALSLNYRNNTNSPILALCKGD